MKNCCNVEHYTVKPNIPVYDWPYDYNNSNNDKRCNCCYGSEFMMTVISNLQSTIATLQNTINDMSLGTIDPLQIKNAVAEYLSILDNANVLKNLIDREIENKLGADLIDKVNNILSTIDSLQPIIDNMDKLLELTELDVDGLSRLSSELAALRNRVNGITDNLTSTINDAVDSRLQNSTTLNDKINQAINNNSKVNQLGQDLTSHIDNTNMHFRSGDVHVTQGDVDRWNTASSYTSDIAFTVENKMLTIQKIA